MFPFRQVDHIDPLIDHVIQVLLISRALSLGGWSDVWIQQKKFRAKTGRIRRGIENVNVDVITISPDNIWTLLV